MKTQELLKILKKNGCKLKRNGSRHDVWYRTLQEKNLPYHDTKPKFQFEH